MSGSATASALTELNQYLEYYLDQKMQENRIPEKGISRQDFIISYNYKYILPDIPVVLLYFTENNCKFIYIFKGKHISLCSLFYK